MDTPRTIFPGRNSNTHPSQEQNLTGLGSGIEYSLAGRSANSLPLPEYTAQSQGRVVVIITVYRSGQVIRAVAGARGTTTNDQVLWRAAEEAAMKARFDVKNDAPHEQSGTISYRFVRN